MTTEVATPVRAEDQAAVLGLVQRITTAWQANDAETLCTVYAQDASIILPGAHLKGRPAIQDWMTQALAGKWKGTQVLGAPLELRYLTDDTLLLLSSGGAYLPGATEVPVEHAIRGMWIFQKRDGEWIITAYGNTPVGSTLPLPGN
jgi:uncharacterized protein (TIGR02246 family)